MIVKLFILIIIVWFGFRVYQALQIKKQDRHPSQKAQDMVSCETCGIHVPIEEALKDGDKYFCSKHHLPKKNQH